MYTSLQAAIDAAGIEDEISIPAGATYVLDRSAVTLQGRLANRGTLALEAGAGLILGVGATLTNEGLINLRGEAALVGRNYFGCIGSPSLANAGTLRRSAGGGYTSVGSCLALSNAGTIKARAGILSLQVPSPFSTSGTLRVAPGVRIEASGEIQLTNGLIDLQDVTLFVNGRAVIAGGATRRYRSCRG